MKSLVLVSALLAVSSAATIHRRDIFEVSDYSTKTKCMDDLGCFPITDDFFHALYRPINLLPADRENINTKFFLYTRQNKNEQTPLRALKDSTLDKSTFSASRKTKVIIHGFLDSEWLADWMHKMKDELLVYADYNVIMVDWFGGSKLPYTQATANTRVVGAELALLLKWLKDKTGMKLEDCHILGHSLGSHAAGYAGASLKTIGRITAMDPAEPYFQNMPESVRIDPSDALFVDAIHTDSRSILVAGLGMDQLVGHVDFFPNGGFSQPGCDLSKFKTFITEGLVGGLRNAVACNHHRVLDFVKEGVNPGQCVQTGYACESWDKFRGGHCSDCGTNGEKCAILGENTPDHSMKFKNKPQQRFYLKTAGKTPFCQFNYHITVKVHSDNSNSKDGSLTFKVKGAKSSADFKPNDGSSFSLEPGKTYTFVLASQKDLGTLSQLTINWSTSIWGMLTKRKVKLESVQIKPMNGLDEKLKAADGKKFCASQLGELERNTDYLLTSKNFC